MKTNEYGEMENYKARLAAQGFTQVKKRDYDETFYPVVQVKSLLLCLCKEV